MLKPIKARRRLMALIAILAVLGAVSFVRTHQSRAQVGDTTTVVAITTTPDVEPDDAQIETAVRQAIALAGGLPSKVAPGKKIVIQPNLVEAGWYSGEGVTPNTKVIRTVVQMCLEKGCSPADITICEGSANYRAYSDWGGYNDRQMTLKSFKDLGLDTNGDMKEDVTGVNLVNADNVGKAYSEYPDFSGPYNSFYVTSYSKSVRSGCTTLPNLAVDRVYAIPNCVAKADVLIRIPALKNHNLAGVTGALKLAFGLAPSDIYHAFGNGYKWSLLHKVDGTSWASLGELTSNADGQCDLTYIRPPDFVVIDGLVGVINGPTGVDGQVDYPAAGKMHCILAGTDPVAIDSVEALACGYQISSIKSINVAANEDGNGTYVLGTNNPKNIEIKGVHVKDIRRWFPNYGCAVRGECGAPVIDDLTVPNGYQVWGNKLLVTPVNPADTGGSIDDPNLEPSKLCKGELYVDGVLVDSKSYASGLTTRWNIPSDVTEGAHTIKYILYDNMLNENDQSATLTNGDLKCEKTVYVHKGGNGAVGALHNMINGTSASLPVAVTGMGTALDNQTFFVTSLDGGAGIKVQYATTAPIFSAGDQVSIAGTMGAVNGQRVFYCTSVSSLNATSAVKPKMMPNKTVGGGAINDFTTGIPGATGAYNLGSLVRVSGVVSAGGSDYFYVNDGSMGGANKLKVKCGSFTKPSPGKFVSVVGFSCAENVSGVIKSVVVMRSANDFVIYK